MASTATRGYGTKFAKVSGTNQTLIAQMRDVSGPSLDVDAIETSNTDSAGRTAEFIPGFINGGEVSFDLVYAKAQATAIKADIDAGTVARYQVELPDRTNTSGVGSTFAFDGFPTKMGSEAPYKDVVTSAVTYKVAGAITYTASV